jgi:hypothetical protein
MNLLKERYSRPLLLIRKGERRIQWQLLVFLLPRTRATNFLRAAAFVFIAIGLSLQSHSRTLAANRARASILRHSRVRFIYVVTKSKVTRNTVLCQKKCVGILCGEFLNEMGALKNNALSIFIIRLDLQIQFNAA